MLIVRLGSSKCFLRFGIVMVTGVDECLGFHVFFHKIMQMDWCNASFVE